MKKIKPGEPIRVELSERDRELLLGHTLADPEYANRLRPIGLRRFVAEYTLNDVEDIMGFIALEANNTKSTDLQTELDDLFDRLEVVQSLYDDGPVA